MSAALDSRRDTRAVDLLLAHCAAVKRAQRRPVFERLRELIGAELTGLLLVGLTGDHRTRWARRPG